MHKSCLDQFLSPFIVDILHMLFMGFFWDEPKWDVDTHLIIPLPSDFQFAALRLTSYCCCYWLRFLFFIPFLPLDGRGSLENELGVV